MKPSLVFEQDPAGPRVPGRPARDAGGDPDAKARVVVQLRESQRNELFAFATANGLTASEVIRRALQAMGVTST